MQEGSRMNIESACIGRFGYVSVYDPERHMARVRFPDKDNLVSGWLPVSASNTKGNKDEVHLDVDEHVFCNMLGNGLEQGVVLCSIWDDKNKPPIGDQDVRQTTFKDGTQIAYNRKTHDLSVKVVSGGRVLVEVPGGIVSIDVPGGVIETNSDSISSGTTGGSSGISNDGMRRVYAEKKSFTRAGEEIQIGTPYPEKEILTTPTVTIQSSQKTQVISDGPIELTTKSCIKLNADDVVIHGRIWGDNMHPINDYPGG